MIYKFFREKMNNEFTLFSKKVEDLVDSPYRELESNRVPFKSNVTLFLTQNCIISLSESPFFVVSINELF